LSLQTVAQGSKPDLLLYTLNVQVHSLFIQAHWIGKCMLCVNYRSVLKDTLTSWITNDSKNDLLKYRESVH